MERGPLVLTVMGAALAIAGAVRFARMGHFTWTQVGLCLLMVPVSLLILLVADYTLHHSRIGLLIMLALIVMLSVTHPSFCVGMGLALIGMVAAKGFGASA